MKPDQPVISPATRGLLFALFALFALLSANGIYLLLVRLAQWRTGMPYQDLFYQQMFLLHLAGGLVLVPLFAVFVSSHLRRAIHRTNRRAVRAGLGLLAGATVLILSGISLIRVEGFDFAALIPRDLAYWSHLVTALLVAWLFVLHRLAGPRLRWRWGAGWALATAVVTVLLLRPLLNEVPSDDAPRSDADSRFFPALSQTPGDQLIPADQLMVNEYCQECHQDSYDHWFHSAHHFSSFNNPAYRFTVMLTREKLQARDGDVTASRFCAGCHDPVPLFAGLWDDPQFGHTETPESQAGIPCLGCHAVTAVNSPRGNADYLIEAPTHYPFAFSDSTLLRAVSRQLIRANPEMHKRSFLKPLHQTAEFCGTCHKVHLPEALNDYKWLRGQNHYDAFLLSGVSGHGITSFYYPAKAQPNCNGCHMPPSAAPHDAAADDTEEGQPAVKNHLFPAANTALAHWNEAPPWVAAAHREMLEGAVRVDLFGLRRGEDIDGELIAPLGTTPVQVEAGETYLLEVVIRTLTLGHLLTQGTADSNELWLELEISGADGTVLSTSGAMAPDGSVHPGSHFVNSYVLDRQGNRIDRRNAEDIFTTLYSHQIPPGAADTLHYSLTIPATARGALQVTAKLNYRKFDTTYLKLIQGEQFSRNDLPVTVMASDAITLGIDDAAPARANDDPLSSVPLWMRWNDYGIGLLRKDLKGAAKGQLRQAEAAFQQVERLGRADGPLNLARTYLREGRLDEAAGALRRAADVSPPPPAWSLAWFGGQVQKQRGEFDSAIENFSAIVENRFPGINERGFDFSLDYRVLNELGQTQLDLARQLRRSPGQAETAAALLSDASDNFSRTLAIDPENQSAHYNLALIYELRGDSELAARHRSLHGQYKPDDQAEALASARHRRANPYADHAAEAVVIYELQPSTGGSFALSQETTR